jgi:phosphoglycerate kinase
MLDTARSVMERARERDVELMLPGDVVVTDNLDGTGRITVVPVDSVGPDDLIVDLGPESRRRYAEALGDARTVFWNGPMGVFEVDAFAAGTLAVAEAMAACGGFTVVGGGESVMAAKKAGVEDRMSHVSTGGGASLKFITGDPLPALVVLEEGS